MIRIWLWVTMSLLLCSYDTHAQYFGRNKPRYNTFDFQVLETDHLSIYHYLQDNRSLLMQFAREADTWFAMHKAILRDSVPGLNPFILYNNHAHFQQTNTIGGRVSVGTGGVTEALKNRVIMPLSFTNRQTRHVLGHELVHVFHFNMMNRDSTNRNDLRNVPLWYIEGMAEYMSIGRIDPHTAMWMRDAVLYDDIPSIKDMNNYAKYFPYRFGHAFLAFLTGVFGDDVMGQLYIQTARFGLEMGIQTVLGVKMEDLSKLWLESLKRHYGPYLEGKKDRAPGQKLLSAELGGGEMNLSPVLSPDGNYMIFLSEKSLFSLDLYLADARTGEVIRKVASSLRESEIDDFNNIESAGTWSPDSQQYAFVAFKRGRNILVIKDVNSGRTVEEIVIRDLESFTQPAWSPNGRDIVLVGKKNGQTDLFLYNLISKKLTQMTDDEYSEVHPAFNRDGRRLVFATDELSFRGEKRNGNYNFSIATMDMDYFSTQIINVFPGADNLNPVFDQDDQIYFLSDRDGFRNIYRYDERRKEVYQMTDILTGISGITFFSPALSIGGRRDRLAFSHFANRKYNIHTVLASSLEGKLVNSTGIDMNAALLPPGNPRRANFVMASLDNFDRLVDQGYSNFFDRDYRPKFRLDYIGGGTGMGVNTANALGTNTAIAGGVDMLFSDILGDQMLYGGLFLNGEIYDAGGQVLYLNRKRKLAWGIQLSHIPFVSGAVQYGGQVILTDQFGNQILTDRFNVFRDRLYQNQANLIFEVPLSVTRRFEFGTGYAIFYNRRDIVSNFYDVFGRLVLQERERIPTPGSLSMGSVNAAFVGDNSVFGLTSPLMGHRYRISGEAFFGDLNFYTNLWDLRKYHFWKPINISYRFLHLARYGNDADRVFRLFAIDPMLVRGFGRIGLDQFESLHGLGVANISGSKMAVGNFEVRIPFTGPKRLALIGTNFLFTDLALFSDAGIAWSEFNQFSENANVKPAILASTGVSLRFNVFGAMILETFYAFPIINGAFQRGSFGFNIIPGW